MSDADSLPVPLEFRGDTEEECREAMNCLSAYLVAEADMAKKRNPPGWKLELDIRWDELVITWAKIYGYTGGEQPQRRARNPGRRQHLGTPGGGEPPAGHRWRLEQPR